MDESLFIMLESLGINRQEALTVQGISVTTNYDVNVIDDIYHPRPFYQYTVPLTHETIITYLDGTVRTIIERDYTHEEGYQKGYETRKIVQN